MYNTYTVQPIYRRTNPRSTSLQDFEEGVKVGGKLIKALRFADDQAMVAGKVEDLQRMMDRLNKTTTEYGTKINTKKTKVMKISRIEGEEKNLKITIDGEEIKQVTEFCYLGSLISDDAKCHTEIKKRIAMGKEAFTKRKELLKEELNRGINKRMDKDLDDEKRGGHILRRDSLKKEILE